MMFQQRLLSLTSATLFCASLALGLLGISAATNAQTSAGDATLFSVGNRTVTADEFRYIYSKTNGAKATFTEASLKDYLELYTKFKLKVARARDMRLDTIPALREELNGYRKQLANSYLIDKTLVEQLTREAYERLKEDVSISHILVQVAVTASPADTLTAYRKIQAAYNRLKSGEAFEAVAKDASEDKGTSDNGGLIGYFTALQLPGFYSLETAAYTTPVKQTSGIFRTPLGYHILKVNDRRKAYGEVQAAHILARVAQDAPAAEQAAAKKRIDSIYTALQGGAKFEDLATSRSDDYLTSGKNGVIGWFSINKYEPAFENAAFALVKNGDYSAPVRSVIGWHIIKRLDRKVNPTYEELRSEIQGKVKRDVRFEKAQDAMVAKIKAESGFKENADLKKAYLAKLNKTFLTYTWRDSSYVADKDKSLFSVGTTSIKFADFTAYLERMGSARTRRGETADIPTVFDEVYQKLVGQKAMEFEETQLDKKYPEFRSLMREYEEGILLFEATKRMVWDKASEDTTGLNKFFIAQNGKYTWSNRAKYADIKLKTTDPKAIEKARALFAKKPLKDVIEKLNKGKKEPLATYRESSVEKGKNPAIDALKWEKGTMSNAVKTDSTTSFIVITDLLAPAPKTLKEARGYAVADYQDYLEKTWLEELRKAYPVTVNQDVLKGLMK